MPYLSTLAKGKRKKKNCKKCAHKSMYFIIYMSLCPSPFQPSLLLLH